MPVLKDGKRENINMGGNSLDAEPHPLSCLRQSLLFTTAYARLARDSIAALYRSAGITEGCYCCIWSYMGSGGSTLVPYAYIASALPLGGSTPALFTAFLS